MTFFMLDKSHNFFQYCSPRDQKSGKQQKGEICFSLLNYTLHNFHQGKLLCKALMKTGRVHFKLIEFPSELSTRNIH